MLRTHSRVIDTASADHWAWKRLKGERLRGRVKDYFTNAKWNRALAELASSLLQRAVADIGTVKEALENAPASDGGSGGGGDREFMFLIDDAKDTNVRADDSPAPSPARLLLRNSTRQ